MSIQTFEDRLVWRNKDVVFCQLGTGVALLSMSSATYYSLNKVAGRVWDLLAEKTTVSQLCDSIVAKYDVEPAVCFKDITVLLAQLADAGLVGLSDHETKAA